MQRLSNRKLGTLPGDGDRIDRGPWKIMAVGCGLPDPVLYPSKVATTYDKYIVEVSMLVWRDVHSKDGMDPNQLREWKTHEAEGFRRIDRLQASLDMCRKRGIRVVASYRMNAEDYYMHTWKLSDLGRAHPEWRIPETSALDPAVPEVYEHRMKIFREVLENYDIDGIQFNWRRWYHMISDPLKNHPILTRMVRETRQLLDEAEKAAGATAFGRDCRTITSRSFCKRGLSRCHLRRTHEYVLPTPRSGPGDLD